MRFHFRHLASLTLVLIAAAACKGSSGNGTGSGAPCTTASDCASGELCVTLGPASTCTLDCTGSTNACGASASCAGVGSIGVSVCQPSTSSGKPSPSSQPKISCKSDADCAKIHAGSVCGEWMGVRDCTIDCTSDSQCNPPAVGGVSTTFFGCQPDQGTSGRNVCLPRQQCIENPESCISGFPGGTGGFPGGAGGFPGGAGGFPGGAGGSPGGAGGAGGFGGGF